ncbi:MAG: hypothetical protein LBO21_01810 [Synergistaceae bacterium]|jgi:hypothetical protein|nr:hypothetical protein [Synergistaceae bacterium]
MKTLQFETGDGIHRVSGIVVYCGKDIAITIGGGDTPHVGAASVASPRQSLRKDGTISASASVLCVMGHKDDMPARKAALRFASELNTNVVVSVGLHIDNPKESDFSAIQNNFDSLLDMISEGLKRESI